MKKLFVEVGDAKSLQLIGDDHTHIAYALRLKIGDKLTLCDGKYDYAAQIAEIRKTCTTVDITGMTAIDSEPKIEVTLFAAAIKGERMDFAVQKATELGVKSVVPFLSQYVQVKPESIKTERLNKIALEAAKQCGRGFVPPVYAAVTFREMLDLLKPFPCCLFLNESETKADFRTFLRAKRDVKKLALIVGPEGGFSLKEAEKLRTAVGTGVTLGRRILRAETAAIAALSAVMYEFGEWR